MIRRHWSFLAGLLLVCMVAYAGGYTGDFLKLRPAPLPAAGKDGELRVDSADANKLKKYSETAAAWEEISGSGGGGAGGVTYWSDFQADDIARVLEDADYTTYAGTPDNAASNLSIASETTNPLSGDASYSLVKAAADASGEAWILPLENPDDAADNTLDRLCKTGGETQYLTFKYETSANYDNSANERILVYTYGDSSGLQACSARDILSGDFTNQVPIAPDGGQYQCVFSCASGDTAIDAVLAYSGTASNAVTFTVDEVKIGPDSVITAPIVTKLAEDEEWIDNFANATTSVDVFRQGSSVFVIGTTTLTGTVSESDLDITIPSAYTHEATALDYAGSGSILDTGTLAYPASVRIKDADELRVLAFNAASTYASETSIGSGVPFTWASGDQITWHASWKVAAWNDSAILSTTQVDHSILKIRATFASSETGFDNTENDVQWDTLSDESNFTSSFDTATGIFTAPFTGWYFFASNINSTLLSGSDRLILRFTHSVDGVLSQCTNGSTVTNTGVNCFLLEYMEQGETIKNTTQATTDTDWGINTSSHMNIFGLPDFSTFSVFGVYEVVSAESSAVDMSSETSATWLDQITGNSVSLSAGTWLIWGACEYNHDASPVPTFSNMLTSLWSANGTGTSTPPATLASDGWTVDNIIRVPQWTFGSGSLSRMYLPTDHVIATHTSSSAKTVYTACYAEAAANFANGTYRANINAKRLK